MFRAPKCVRTHVACSVVVSGCRCLVASNRRALRRRPAPRRVVHLHPQHHHHQMPRQGLTDSDEMLCGTADLCDHDPPVAMSPNAVQRPPSQDHPGPFLPPFHSNIHGNRQHSPTANRRRGCSVRSQCRCVYALPLPSPMQPSVTSHAEDNVHRKQNLRPSLP